MNFDQLDLEMRQFETVSDICIPPDVRMVARIDGRSFTRLTKDVCKFEAPFDIRFRDAMVATTKSLMSCGFDVRYAFVQSDEISILFSPKESSFGRKLRKFNSVLAAHASAFFTMQISELATFDCRVSQLPNVGRVVDYFRWRQQDSCRNALNAHCYWAIRKSGRSGRTAHRTMSGMTVVQKRRLLNLEYGIDFDELPAWQKFGTALYWESFKKYSLNPITGQHVKAIRRRVKIDSELPFGDEYSHFLRRNFVTDE